METVAANATVGDRGRQGKGLGHLGLVAMKGGIEATHLRQLRLVLQQQADRLEVMRLVQRCQRDELLQVSDDLGGQPHRRSVGEAAVHHTMADGGQPVFPELLAQEACQMGDGAIVTKRFTGRPLPFADHGARRILDLEAGRRV